MGDNHKLLPPKSVALDFEDASGIWMYLQNKKIDTYQVDGEIPLDMRTAIIWRSWSDLVSVKLIMTNMRFILIRLGNTSKTSDKDEQIIIDYENITRIDWDEKHKICIYCTSYQQKDIPLYVWDNSRIKRAWEAVYAPYMEWYRECIKPVVEKTAEKETAKYHRLWKCPTCGKVNAGKKCNKCGFPLHKLHNDKKAMRSIRFCCEKCHTALPQDAKYCPKCGSALILDS